MEILLANPRGFCAGVDRAITIVENALVLFGKPIYVRHEVVHNRYVVDDLKSRGAIFVEELDEVPEESVVIFSAHGVSQSVRKEAAARSLKVFDATCPLVTKVHMEVARASKKKQEVILIGHKGHPEVEGTMGQYNNKDGKIYLVESIEDIKSLKVIDENNLHFVTQTTLSVDETHDIIEGLKNKYNNIQGPRKEDICYATQNRQNAVRQLAESVDLMIVVGSKNSSNSNRLSELSENLGTKSYLIDSIDQLNENWFIEVNKLGITAGASAPEELIQKILKKIVNDFGGEVKEYSGCREDMYFEVPKELKIKQII